jgi:AraC-like DNA-binding protein
MRRISTGGTAPREQFDFWRSLFAGVDIQVPRAVARAGFHADLTQLAGGRGVLFNAFEADASVNRFRASPSESLYCVALLRSGCVEFTDPRGSSLVTTGGLFLLDHSRPVTTRNSHYTFSHLMLPRSLVLEALGGDPLGAEGLLRLDGDRLTPFLSSQLELLSEHGAQLEEQERLAAINASVDLSLALLRARLREGSDAGEAGCEGLFAAARLYIERHAHEPSLTADQVASAVGCSRARLYRLFAARELGVHALIREIRLKRSGERLAAEPLAQVGVIAFESGFADTPTFNRAFRRRFGMSPSEWRARHARRAG